MKKLTFILTLSLMSIAAFGGEEVQRLLEPYEKIETLTCRLRRTRQTPAGEIKYVSKIYYTNQDQLHAENLEPIKRFTIANGKTLHQYMLGASKGFSRPIENLSPQMKLSLRQVPGTPMEHLLRLIDSPEKKLPPGANQEKRVQVDCDGKYIVLTIDEKNLLTKIDFFSDQTLQDVNATYTYRRYKEVLPSVFVPFQHDAELKVQSETITEILRIDLFEANKPIAPSNFDFKNFISNDIDFVDSFEEITQSNE